jgi:hypothetical protein
MKRTLTLLITQLFCFTIASNAQDLGLQLADSAFGSPSILGAPRPKGISVKNERVENFRVHSTSDYIGDDSRKLNKNNRWELKLKLPVLNMDRFKMAAGIEYYVEDFRFLHPEDLQDSNAYPLYRTLEDRSLKSLAGGLYFVIPMKNQKYIAVRASGSLNGDYSPTDLPNSEYFKYSITPVLGWRRTPFFTWGIGLNYGYTFGRRSLVPILVYSRTYTKRWGIDAALPASIKVRRTSNNEKSIHYGIVELNGANYTIQVDDPVLKKHNPLSLQKSEVRGMITWEREIYDFLWFSVSGGTRANIRFRLAERDKFEARSPDILVNNTMKPAFFFNASIFIVPPRKLVDRQKQ